MRGILVLINDVWNVSYGGDKVARVMSACERQLNLTNLNQEVEFTLKNPMGSEGLISLAKLDIESLRIPVPKEKWGVHETHCCETHGCKYGNPECPVELGLTKQEYPCEHNDFSPCFPEPSITWHQVLKEHLASTKKGEDFLQFLINNFEPPKRKCNG